MPQLKKALHYAIASVESFSLIPPLLLDSNTGRKASTWFIPSKATIPSSLYPEPIRKDVLRFSKHDTNALFALKAGNQFGSIGIYLYILIIIIIIVEIESLCCLIN